MKYVTIYQNKRSGEYFVFVKENGKNTGQFIIPGGELKELSFEFFENETDITEEKFFSSIIISTEQKNSYKAIKSKSEIPEHPTIEEAWGTKSPWGHNTTNTESGYIDYCLYFNEDGVTIAEIADRCGCTELRVKNHIKHLEKGTRNGGAPAKIVKISNGGPHPRLKLID